MLSSLLDVWLQCVWLHVDSAINLPFCLSVGNDRYVCKTVLMTVFVNLVGRNHMHYMKICKILLEEC